MSHLGVWSTELGVPSHEKKHVVPSQKSSFEMDYMRVCTRCGVVTTKLNLYVCGVSGHR